LSENYNANAAKRNVKVIKLACRRGEVVEDVSIKRIGISKILLIIVDIFYLRDA
jgi:hypothetical protein